MTYAGIHMFMDKLNHLTIDSPLFNNPRHQFQLLCDELGSMIQTLFIDQHQLDLQKLDDLKQRFIFAAEEAEYIVDVFLSRVHITNNGLFPKLGNNANFIVSVAFNLDHVWRSLKSIKAEFMSMRIDNIKMVSSLRTVRTQNQSVGAPISSSKRSLGSKKRMDEIIVGLDHDAALIIDKLVEDQKKVDVVSIAGMGGIGKTTLATKVFNDSYVKHHFHVRIWVTVSQTYDKRIVLIRILESISAQLDLEKTSDSRLHEMVHKHLKGKRYLIVIDDIWQTETWDNMKLFFPHDNTGSRILLTSRLTEVAKHANSDGLIHDVGYMNKEEGWELLCQKVFQGNEYPKWAIEPGMQIVESCQGLPLAVVVIAGVLAKDAWSKKLWLEIAYKASSYLVDDQNGCLEILALSYNHLPLHLRECFLYLGGFPEDHKFQVQRLIWLWVAEGFIQQDGIRSLEDIAEAYLIDLIDRNLVIVARRRKSNGAVKVCILHDLVRELCLKKAKEERFILQTKMRASPRKPVRLFINGIILEFLYVSTQNLRSILCFSDFRSLNDSIENGICSFVLLRVLDLQGCLLNDFPKGIELLVHLRHLAIRMISADLPYGICSLWGLQTLIYVTEQNTVYLPPNISDLVNLRHLWCHFHIRDRLKLPFFLPSLRNPMNLQTISGVVLGGAWGENFQKCFPYIKELTCIAYLATDYDFKSLTYLEKLKFTGYKKTRVTFSATLKSLTLAKCRLPWSDMSIIQSLPNLQVLKLQSSAFEGRCWNTDGHEFPQLKFLKLEELDIQVWEAYSRSFPCLRQLKIVWCWYLEEIPLEIGDIPTLELIKIKGSRDCANESVRRIQKEQNEFGNDDLKIHIIEIKTIPLPRLLQMYLNA